MVGKEGFRNGGGSGCTVDHVSYSEFHEGFIQIAYLITLCPRKLAFACISDVPLQTALEKLSRLL